jgi:prepilin-type N-terminal cleavage/methylation domain-containing protein
MNAELYVGVITVSILFSLIEVLIVLSVVLINAVIC